MLRAVDVVNTVPKLRAAITCGCCCCIHAFDGMYNFRYVHTTLVPCVLGSIQCDYKGNLHRKPEFDKMGKFEIFV